MTRLAFSLRSALLLAALFICASCGDKAECVLDTDCELRERCSADNQCIPLGGTPTPTDAGADDSGGGEEDSGASDDGE